MPTIYEPKGKAREYSPLALNLYKGCDHGCSYCYVPAMMKRFNPAYDHAKVEPRKGIIEQLEKDAKKYYGTDKQVLLSFTGDPYCRADDKLKLTDTALVVLLNNKIPVSILTKGYPYIRNNKYLYSSFGESFKFGTTLVYDNDRDYIRNEQGANDYELRITTLEYLKNRGIQTWVSLEPVIIPEQSLNLIDMTYEFTGHYKVGKINHNPQLEKDIDWPKFVVDVVTKLRKLNKPFYLKKSLQAYVPEGFELTPEEVDMDFLNVKPFAKEALL